MEAGSPQQATSVHDAGTAVSLAADEVHLWTIDVSPESTIPSHAAPDALGPESYLRAMTPECVTSPEERARAARLRRPGDGTRYLAAHGALRLILARYLECDPTSVRFESGHGGKPTIVDASLQFNLSHSGAVALIVVAQARQVGVDVERHRQISDLDGIVARICTPREQSALDGVAPTERQGAFLAMWTRKEALAKMTGEGIRAVSRDATLGTHQDCRLEQLRDLPGYSACVAAQGTDWRLVRRS